MNKIWVLGSPLILTTAGALPLAPPTYLLPISVFWMPCTVALFVCNSKLRLNSSLSSPTQRQASTSASAPPRSSVLQPSIPVPQRKAPTTSSGPTALYCHSSTAGKPGPMWNSWWLCQLMASQDCSHHEQREITFGEFSKSHTPFSIHPLEGFWSLAKKATSSVLQFVHFMLMMLWENDKDQLGAARLVKCSVVGTLCCNRCYSTGLKNTPWQQHRGWSRGPGTMVANFLQEGNGKSLPSCHQKECWRPCAITTEEYCFVGQPKGKR